jgi:lysophospholipase L1-like esterase
MKQSILAKLWLSLKAGINLMLVGVLFAVLIIEIVTRVMPGLIPSAVKLHFYDNTYVFRGLLADDKIGVKYAPGLVNFPAPIIDDTGRWSDYPLSTVALGYPDIGFKDDGIDGPPFAVAIGDSMTSCVGVKVEDCWVEVLERRSGLDFANLGVEGSSAQLEQRMLVRYGLPLRPRLVLWVFFANDLDDAWRFAQFGRGGIRDGQFWQSPVRTWLVENSATYMLLTFFWHNYDFIYNLVTHQRPVLTHTATYTYDPTNVIWWETVTNLSNPRIATGFDITKTTLLQARQQTEAAGARFVVVIIPTREQVYYEDDSFKAQLDMLNQHLIDFCQQHKIEIIDLTPAMRQKAQTEPLLYFKSDLHLNPAGSRVVGELLYQQLAAFLRP